MIETARLAVEKNLTVRDLEKKAQGKRKKVTSSVSQKAFSRDSYFDEMEIALKETLHRKVKILSEGEKGCLQIEFYRREELRDLAERLAGQE